MTLLNFPTGTIVPFASSIVPKGWLPCDGSAYDGNLPEFNALWLVVGTTYGGSFQGNFKVPHLGGRIPVGVTAGASGTGINGPIGSWEGTNSVTLTSAQSGVKNHRHSVNDPGHNHGGSAAGSYTSHYHTVRYATTTVDTKNANRNTKHPDGATPKAEFTTNPGFSVSFGSGSLNSISVSNRTASNATSAHTNIQPEIAFKYIIKL